jgi:hypothetical protein
MASISEAYGSNYKEQSCKDAIMANVRLITNNIINRKLTFRYDSRTMWSNLNMKQSAIEVLTSEINKDSKTRIKHIPKTSQDTSMFPYLINGPVEYFVIVDLKTTPVKIYSIYISPTLIEAF